LTSRAKGYAPPENMLLLTINQICKRKELSSRNTNPPNTINDHERDRDIL